MGDGEFGHDPSVLSRLAGEVRAVHAMGVEQCLVIGGGNIVRGNTLAASQGIERANADYMGMLATVINALAVQSVLEQARAADPRAVGDPHGRGVRALHPPPRDPAHGEGHGS